MIVVDTSVWVLLADSDDPRSAAAIAAFEPLLDAHQIIAPVLVGYELTQFIHVNHRRNDEALALRQGRVAALVGALELRPTDLLGAGALAERYKLSAYDASFLELAQRTDAILATEDDRLRKAAIKELGARRSLDVEGLVRLAKRTRQVA